LQFVPWNLWFGLSLLAKPSKGHGISLVCRRFSGDRTRAHGYAPALGGYGCRVGLEEAHVSILIPYIRKNAAGCQGEFLEIVVFPYFSKK
jgi:hypothetical protein